MSQLCLCCLPSTISIFGQDGKFVTSSYYERLMRELDKNLALRVEETDNSDSWIVYGRGVLHILCTN